MSDQNQNALSKDEHTELKSRILNSARKIRHSRKKKRLQRLVFYGSAACIIVAIGFFYFFQSKAETPLERFITNAPSIDYTSHDGVTIVLGTGESLQLPNLDETVQYSKSGDEVHLGSGESYQQQLEQVGQPTFNTILVPYGKRTNLTLSDGTKVWLNSGSKMIYPAVFNSNLREIYLEGEAIFDVVHNPVKPFRVLSNNQEVEVLGTVFNVSSYPKDEELQTVLKSGSVQLTYNKDTRTTFKIAPGTLSSYNVKTAKIATKQVNVEDYFSWKNGVLNLQNHTLESITTKLSRYYNVKIYIFGEQLRKETFSGKLDLKEDVNRVINVINKTSNFKIKKQDDKIILTR
ncbi:MAG: FecR domain-containing protein [Bacteroidota bacterium]